jgi:hypothetical protein
MEQPPPAPIDPDSVATVIVPLRAANVPFAVDPKWDATPEDQWIWYRAQQIQDEFFAQKYEMGPFIGAVTHKEAASRGMLLRHLLGQSRSRIDVGELVSSWANPPLLKLKEEAQRLFLEDAAGDSVVHAIEE